MNISFKDWVQEQEPIITEGWMEAIQRLPEVGPQLAKYLPLALREIDENPDLRSVVENRSMFMALYHALKRVTDPEFMANLKRVSDEEINQQLQGLQELANTEILVRQRLLPVWRMLVRTLDFFHITPLITRAIPKFGEFIKCFSQLIGVQEKDQFRALAKCAASAFFEFAHQVTSTTLFSGLAAKIVAILGMIGLAGKLTVVVLVVWVLLLILEHVKGKMNPSRQMATVIGMVIKLFGGGHEKPVRPPIFAK